MSTDLENLQARRTSILAELAALDANAPGGLPNGPPGIDHVGYKDSLYRELEQIERRIAALQGPIEFQSEATT